VTVGEGNFELKLALINMVQDSPFCSKPNEDINAHLKRSDRRRNLSSPVPVLIAREGEAMVLCRARCHQHVG
jgi:hypothetical protein